jgi:hypothetical protein
MNRYRWSPQHKPILAAIAKGQIWKEKGAMRTMYGLLVYPCSHEIIGVDVDSSRWIMHNCETYKIHAETEKDIYENYTLLYDNE